MSVLCPLGLLLAACYVAGLSDGPVQTLSLSSLQGSTWQLRNANGSIRLASVVVPGSVTEGLMQHGIIGDPLYRQNEALQRWVSDDDWTFSTRFTLPPAMAAHTHVDLMLDGLDTLAEVTVDAQRVLLAQNFHRQYRVPLPDPSAGEHTLSIAFASPVRHVYAAARRYPYDMPSNLSPGAYLYYNFIRKPASDFGWDWGPAIVPMGLHGSVTLVAYSTPWLSGVHVQQVHAWDQGLITVEVEGEVVWPEAWPDNRTVTLAVDMPRVQGAAASMDFEPQSPGVHYHTLKVQVPLGSVRLWWPRGHGPQPLYPLSVTLTPQGTECDWLSDGGAWPGAVSLRRTLLHPQQPCSAISLMLGFRHIELVTQPLDTAWEDIHVNMSTEDTQPPPSRRPRQTVWKRVSLRSPERNDASGILETRTGRRLEQSVTSTNTTTLSSKEGVGPFVEDPRGIDYITLSHSPELDPRVPRSETRDSNSKGESFYFRVNGVPVYMRGANLIPLDVLHVRGAQQAGIAALLRQAVRANMNMVRVWGGGRYQPDYLYDWCDRQGLLVWQEFMYACAPYPLTPTLMEEGVLEARQEVRRLGYHASVAIWGGNNEVEALFPEYPAVRDNLALYVSDFNTWFTDKIRAVVEQLDPHRPYVDTSPSNGLYSRDPYIKRWGNSQDPRYGDVHLYNYVDDCQDPRLVKPAKFVSETGWQSSPSWAAISRYTAPEDWSVTAPGAQYRQRHPNGDAEMIAQMRRHFRLPAAWTNNSTRTVTKRVKPGAAAVVDGGPAAGMTSSVQLYRTWIYLTQVQQALCISTGAARWLQMSADPSALNMGLLYWQLNDIWPGYSWSSLDYPSAPGAAPHWKPLHYAMARTWAPLAVLTRADGEQAQVNVTSSWGVPLAANVTLRLVPVWATRDNCSAVVGRREVQVPPFAMVPVWSQSVAEVMEAIPGCSINSCFISMEAVYHLLPNTTDQQPGVGNPRTAAGQYHEGMWPTGGLKEMAGATQDDTVNGSRVDDGAGGGGLSESYSQPESVWRAHAQLWLAYWVDMPAMNATGKPILTNWMARSANEVCFTVASDVVLPLLVLETDFEGYFSDNMITVDPCQPQALCFTYDGDMASGSTHFNVEALKANITHMSLADYMG